MNELTPIDSTPATSMTTINIDTLDDEAIKSLIAEGYKLLDRRKRKREKEIREQIKELAASEGIKVSFREPSARRKRSNNSSESN